MQNKNMKISKNQTFFLNLTRFIEIVRLNQLVFTATATACNVLGKAHSKNINRLQQQPAAINTNNRTRSQA